MLVQLPGGSAIDPEGNDVAATDNGEIRLHTQVALSRLIERWKAESHPNLVGLLSSYTDRVQELENAIWDVIVARLPDFAEGVQLDALGRIVGQKRESLGDAAYRAHIKARVRINRSFGLARDVIEMLKLITSASFHFVSGARASFRIIFDVPPENAALGHEIPSLVKQCRAAGVGAIVSMPIDSTRSFTWGSSADPILNSTKGWSSSYDSTVGGLWGHSALA